MVLPMVEKVPSLLDSFPPEAGNPAPETILPGKQNSCGHHSKHLSIYGGKRQELVSQLREAIFRWEAQWRPLRQEKPISTGCQALDALLPQGGWQWGTIVQWLTPSQGTGVKQLALASLKPLVDKSSRLVVVDPLREFYPPAAQAVGIPLEALILIYPQTKKDLLWTIGQVLESGKGVILWADLPRCGQGVYRRFQLTVEQRGSLGFFFGTFGRGKISWWADIQLLVRPLSGQEDKAGWGWQVELLRSRGAFVHKKAVEIFWDEWAHTWGDVPSMALPAAGIRNTAGA